MPTATQRRAGNFITAVNRVAMENFMPETQEAAEREGVRLAKELGGSEEAQTRLQDVVRGFLRGETAADEFVRTAEEHCFLFRPADGPGVTPPNTASLPQPGAAAAKKR